MESEPAVASIALLATWQLGNLTTAVQREQIQQAAHLPHTCRLFVLLAQFCCTVTATLEVFKTRADLNNQLRLASCVECSDQLQHCSTACEYKLVTTEGRLYCRRAEGSV